MKKIIFLLIFTLSLTIPCYAQFVSEVNSSLFLLLAGGTMTGNITMPDNGWIGLGSGAGRIEFDDLATDEVNILGANVGIGTTTPSSITHIKGNTPGTVGSHPAGQLIIQNPTASVLSNVVITAYDSDVGGAPNQQLWYLGSSSITNSNITFLNRRSACLVLGTNNLTRLTILETGNIGIGTTVPPQKLSVVGNIATGDTAEADVDVYHYFSTDGSWTTEYLKWDDGEGRFKLSDDIDVTGNITVSGDAYHITSAEIDSQYMSKKYIDDAAGGLSAQSVKGDHVDSTSEDFVFDDPYRVTSAEAESLLLTHGGAAASYQPLEATLTDIADGIIDENLDNTINPWADNEVVDDLTLATVSGTIDMGGATSLEIPAVDDPTTDAEGEIAWDANDDAIEVYMGDESESALIPAYQKIDALIFAPDGVNDKIPIMRVDALLYPFGIEIDQVSITIPSDGAYTMVFEEWAADPPAEENIISTVTTGAGDSYMEEAPDNDAALDADDYIFLDIPATDIDWIHIQVIFHVNDGN